MLAYAAKSRSEDPYLQVGAVALNAEGRVLATGYNGLKSKFTLSDATWADRDRRRNFIIHAEMNVLSLLRRGEATTLAVTSSPCLDCAKNIVAHGIQRVLYCEDFRDTAGLDLLNDYGVELVKIDKGVVLWHAKNSYDAN